MDDRLAHTDQAYYLALLALGYGAIAQPDWVVPGEGRVSYLWTCHACNYRFEAVASGRASIEIPHGVSLSQDPAPPFAITVEVS